MGQVLSFISLFYFSFSIKYKGIAYGEYNFIEDSKIFFKNT